jgi:hypothetical protein
MGGAGISFPLLGSGYDEEKTRGGEALKRLFDLSEVKK